MGVMYRVAFAVIIAGCGFKTGHALTVGDSSTGSDDAPVRDAARDATPDGPRDAPVSGTGPQLVQIHNSEGNGLMIVPVVLTAQGAGHLNVVFVGWYQSGAINSVVDTAGNTYTSLGNNARNLENQAIWIACDIKAAPLGNTVTANFAGTSQDPDIRVVEYSGIVASSSCLDTAGSLGGSGTAMDSGNITTTNDHDLLVASTFQLYSASAPDPAYRNRGVTGFGDLTEDREVTTKGTYHATATQTMSADWVVSIAAFKAQ
jgi:hypothetical protein